MVNNQCYPPDAVQMDQVLQDAQGQVNQKWQHYYPMLGVNLKVNEKRQEMLFCIKVLIRLPRIPVIG